MALNASLPRVAIIMPMHSDPSSRAKLEIAEAVCAEMGWRLSTPDYLAHDPRFDAAEARLGLARVSLVLADLSGERPSCYFELGFAEALGKRVRIIAQRGTPLHQSGNRAAALFYDGIENYEACLKQVLAAERAKNAENASV